MVTGVTHVTLFYTALRQAEKKVCWLDSLFSNSVCSEKIRHKRHKRHPCELIHDWRLPVRRVPRRCKGRAKQSLGQRPNVNRSVGFFSHPQNSMKGPAND